MDRLLIVVLLMALVTYIPRVVPITLLSDKKLPRFVKNFLYYIPFAVLAALIFPGVFYSTGSIASAAVGLAAAVILALFRLNVILVVFGGIGAAFLFQLIK
jgi:branched-subunit amino acid transport protein